MAFSGLPSKACANCRLRRIKCNLAEPECAQCRRVGKHCPGYRDQLALLFRDENAKVIRKARGRAATALSQKSRGTELEIKSAPSLDTPQTITPSDLEKRSNTSSPSITRFRNLITPADDPGVHFFFYQYMAVAPLAPVANTDIFSSQLWRGVTDYKPFLDAISCVGLAGLSNIKSDRQMMRTARLKYAVTLQRVMSSLQTPGSADLVYTIKAVMMLALFEMVNCDSPGTGMWGVHLDGIAALLNSHGFQKLQVKFGARMRHQFFFAMFVKYVQSGQKFPPAMAKWSRVWGATLGESDTPVVPLTEIILQFVNLNALVAHGQVTDPNSVLHDAFILEEKLEEWRKTLPSEWIYKVIPSSQSLGTYEGQCHIYSDHWIARMWDHYRWTRILVHELILTHIILLPSLPTELYGQQATSVSIISHLASRICASAASQLYRPSRTIPKPPSNSPMTGVFMLLWPLKVAGSAIGVSDALHEWVLDVLENIGQTMGIRQTRVAAFAAIVQREIWKSKAAFGFGDGQYTR